MKEIRITRRTLILAGIATGVVVALVPLSGLLVNIPDEDLKPIGDNADDSSPYQPRLVGDLSQLDRDSLNSFVEWAFDVWQFSGLENYIDTLGGVISLKTTQEPGYLSEYQSAAQLIRDTQLRFNDSKKSFSYLMFTPYEKELPPHSRLARTHRFVLKEFLQHMLISGGFKQFGVSNFDGYIHLPFTDSQSYRRG